MKWNIIKNFTRHNFLWKDSQVFHVEQFVTYNVPCGTLLLIIYIIGNMWGVVYNEDTAYLWKISQQHIHLHTFTKIHFPFTIFAFHPNCLPNFTSQPYPNVYSNLIPYSLSPLTQLPPKIIKIYPKCSILLSTLCEQFTLKRRVLYSRTGGMLSSTRKNTRTVHTEWSFVDFWS